MYKFTISVIALLAGLVVFSCGTTKPVSSSSEAVHSVSSTPSRITQSTQPVSTKKNMKAGITVRRLDTKQFVSCYIYIDGRWLGNVDGGSQKDIELTNGQHIIYLEIRDYNVSPTYRDASDPYIFNIDNDRHLILAELVDDKFIPKGEAVESVGTDSNLLDTAITNTFNALVQNMPQNAIIAIVNISYANNRDQSDANFIIEELSVLMVNSKKFKVVDRQTLDTIRKEQNFQMSGEVGDDSAVSIGKFLGANVVITGSITGTGSQRRLRLRALDVLTAQVLAMTSYGI
jgi:TolB-like protein